MQKIHPVTATLTLAAIVLTAEWAVKREGSLLAQFIAAVGG